MPHFDDASPLLIARQVVAEFPHVGAELNRVAARLQVVVLDRTADDASNETAIAAGLACWTVTVIAEAHGYVPRQVAEDTDLDMSEWEPALHASIAVSGGAPWDGRGDPALRRAFWEWYADEACRLAEDLDAETV